MHQLIARLGANGGRVVARRVAQGHQHLDARSDPLVKVLAVRRILHLQAKEDVTRACLARNEALTSDPHLHEHVEDAHQPVGSTQVLFIMPFVHQREFRPLFP